MHSVNKQSVNRAFLPEIPETQAGMPALLETRSFLYRIRHRLSWKSTAYSRRGQAMIEYLMVAVVLISVVAILAVFLYSFKAYSGRVLDLAASEYP